MSSSSSVSPVLPPRDVPSRWHSYHNSLDSFWSSLYDAKVTDTLSYLRHFLSQKEDPFLLYGDSVYSGKDVWFTSIRWSLSLRSQCPMCPCECELGPPRPHKRVAALLCRNNPSFIFAWIALCMQGYTIALINTYHKVAQILRDIEVSEPQIIVIDSGFHREATHIARHFSETNTKIKIVLTDPIPHSDRDPPSVPFESLSSLSESFSPSSFSPSPHVNTLRMDDPLFYIFTSGTTGRSKAALFSHRRFIGCGVVWTTAMGLTNRDVYYNCLPLFHGNGGCVCLSACVLSGCRMVLKEKFSSSQFWRDVQHYGVTAMIYVGEVWRYILNYYVLHKDTQEKYMKSNPLRIIAGNGLTVSTWSQLKSTFPFVEHIVEHYGMTEMPAGPHMNFYGRPGACGFVPSLSLHLDLYDGMCPKLVRSDRIIKFDVSTNSPIKNDSGFAVEVTQPNDPGECVFLLSRGIEHFDHLLESKDNANSILSNPNSAVNPHVPLDLYSPLGSDPLGVNPNYIPYNGYSDPSQCSTRVYRHLFEYGDAWFSTGDLLKFDEYGFLYFVDRAGDSYRVKGHNVSATEVQDDIMQFNSFASKEPNSPNIVECNVVGVKFGVREGKVGLAALRISHPTRDSNSGTRPFDFDGFFRFLTERLSKYSIPTFYRFLHRENDTTATHKLQKFNLIHEGFDPKNMKIAREENVTPRERKEDGKCESEEQCHKQNEYADELYVIQPKRGKETKHFFMRIDDRTFKTLMEPDYKDFEF